MCQRASGRLKFCEMLGQCDSEELVANLTVVMCLFID